MKTKPRFLGCQRPLSDQEFSLQLQQVREHYQGQAQEVRKAWEHGNLSSAEALTMTQEAYDHAITCLIQARDDQIRLMGQWWLFLTFSLVAAATLLRLLGVW